MLGAILIKVITFISNINQREVKFLYVLECTTYLKLRLVIQLLGMYTCC